jgi:hypothetical protein
MPANSWKAPQEIVDLVDEIKNKSHLPRLEAASIAVVIKDEKPFVNDKLNLGKVSKFSLSAKMWHQKPHDFCITIPADLWATVLNEDQKKAYIDLQLTRCQVEYVPETTEINGKKKAIKDEWGCVKFTNEIKLDTEGNPKWKVSGLDLEVLTSNIRRYGLWYDELLEFKETIVAAVEQ